ncbi:MAG: hypothetical protein ETSY2_49525, partial [Candidatus Entotheonella gemina]
MSCQRQTVSQFTHAVLDAETSPATLQQVVEHGFEQIAEAQTASRAPLACAAGCAFCCYHPVDITAPEAFALAAYLRTVLSDAEFEAVATRLAANAARIQALSHDEHALAQIPCALLNH